MRKFFATLLLICFGMILPVAAMPMRVCLLEQKERAPDCCKKCHVAHEDCCAEVDKVPDSPAPGGFLVIPPFIAHEIPSFEPGILAEIVVVPLESRYSQPIRGPDSPSAFRSVLSVWSI